MKSINKIKIIVFVTLVTLTLSAQDTTTYKTQKLDGGFGYCNIRVQTINIGGLNNLLSSNDYAKINSTQSSWGGGGNFVIKNFLIGGEGAGFFSSQTSKQLNSVQFTGGFGFFNFGYIIYKNKRSILYPLLGVGAGGYDITVNTKSVNTQDPFYSFSGHTNVKSGGLVLDAQMVYQYFLSKSKKQGFCIGLKAGYYFSPNSWKLNVNGNDLNNSPNFNMNGFYATLILGGGSVLSKK